MYEPSKCLLVSPPFPADIKHRNKEWHISVLADQQFPTGVKTKEHLKVAGRWHIFVFQCLFQRICWPFLFFLFPLLLVLDSD